jgi:hypothetical protein
MTDPDPFDEIVQHLDLDLTFPETVEQPTVQPAVQPTGQPTTEPAPQYHHDPEAEPFYRRIEPRDPVPHRPEILLAWFGILGGPTLIMIASITHWILPRPLLLGLGLIFVASAIYLISQLPERGPGEPNWPDDGAQL